MPDQHRTSRNRPLFLLSAARDNGDLVKAACGGCSKPRWYRPADLITLFGDIPCELLEARMPCERCSHPLRISVTHPSAAERETIRVRRLERVWAVRKAEWREE